ncbi:MAG: hypothetical protein NVS3B17_11930 [Vulcanimicrobiaceae bacterium]
MLCDAIGAVRAIADTAARWRNADFPPRVRITRALRTRTGYTEPVIDYALDALFASIDATTVGATIAGELGSLEALAGFSVRRDRPDVSYVPLDRVAIVSSDTTIGVAIAPLIFALCAGCHVDVKDRDDRLVGTFLDTLADESPSLAARATATPWQGDDDAARRAHLGDCDVVVAFGSDAALARIHAGLNARTRFVGFGHRTSVGYITRETLADEARVRAAARGCARDALLYDGEGCLSLHAVFVESGGARAPADFARDLASACDEAAIEFPAGYAERDAATHAYVGAARFRSSQRGDDVHLGTRAPHVVACENLDTPPPLLRRTVACYAVATPDDALGFVRRHALPLEAIALCARTLADIRSMRPDVHAFARACGASRVATLGELQRPPLGGEHGGAGRILPFVRAIYRG